MHDLPLHLQHTINGRNPAQVDMVNIPLFTGVLGFYASQVVVCGFLPVSCFHFQGCKLQLLKGINEQKKSSMAELRQ